LHGPSVADHEKQHNQGCDQHDNAQVAVDQDRLLLVGASLSHHPTIRPKAAPTLDSIPPEMGTPDAAALDAGSLSAANIALCERPHIARTLRPGAIRITQAGGSVVPIRPHRSADASPQVKMAYKLKTALGKRSTAHASIRLSQ